MGTINDPTSCIHPFSFGGMSVLVATASMRDIFKYGPCRFTNNFRLGRWISMIPNWLNMLLSFEIGMSSSAWPQQVVPLSPPRLVVLLLITWVHLLCEAFLLSWFN